MAELRNISYVVQILDCPFSMIYFTGKIEQLTKAKNNPINIQTACIPYDRVNEFIQAEGNNVLVPTYFFQFKVENDTDMERTKVNQNNFIKDIWYVTKKHILYEFLHNLSYRMFN